MNVTALILTFNEARHIERAITSVRGIADRILVVDSGSTDATVEIATRLGAEVRHHPWTNYATQFNWGINTLQPGTGWILRLDADEYLTEPLRREIAEKLGGLSDEVAGVYVGRRMTFLGRIIRYGGLFPIRVVRLFRHGRGRCEMRWMDEHITVNGAVADFQGELIDDNLNSITWWTEKHNGYASREVVDLLNREFGFMPQETIGSLREGRQAEVKRWLKEHVYARMPGGGRAMLYFLYRYVIRLGFLDGRGGTAFHVLQALWYRFLVDTKLHEVRRYMERHGVDAPTAIEQVLRIRVSREATPPP